ncbi:transposase [Streptomyces sp. HUAS ZL42]|uniref:transposase n=1 Tax=Streptomyces sp. HUAS ZL42 TaxID=3231715 RepID=UPI00345EF68A
MGSVVRGAVLPSLRIGGPRREDLDCFRDVVLHGAHVAVLPHAAGDLALPGPVAEMGAVGDDGRLVQEQVGQHIDGRSDPAFRTKPQLSAALAARAKEAGFACGAVVADCAYSTSDDWYHALREAGLPYVVALKPHRST